jgi:hypothetical protein
MGITVSGSTMTISIKVSAKLGNTVVTVAATQAVMQSSVASTFVRPNTVSAVTGTTTGRTP